MHRFLIPAPACPRPHLLAAQSLDDRQRQRRVGVSWARDAVDVLHRERDLLHFLDSARSSRSFRTRQPFLLGPFRRGSSRKSFSRYSQAVSSEANGRQPLSNPLSL